MTLSATQKSKDKHRTVDYGVMYVYLPVGTGRDDAPVVREGHELRVEHVVLVAGVEARGRRAHLPVPQHEGHVVRPRQEQAASAVEAYGVHAAPVLPQPSLYAKRLHKFLHSQADPVVTMWKQQLNYKLLLAEGDCPPWN